MLETSDRAYHEARARDELRLARKSSDPAVASLHRELAALHRRRMVAIVEETEPLASTFGQPAAI